MNCSRYCLEFSNGSAKRFISSNIKYFKRFYTDGLKVTKPKNKNLMNEKPTLRNKLPLNIQSLIQEAEIETTIVSNLVNYNSKPQLNRGENKFDVVVNQIHNDKSNSFISTYDYDEDITENENNETSENVRQENTTIEKLCHEDVDSVLEKYENFNGMCERGDILTAIDESSHDDTILKSKNPSFNMKSILDSGQELESTDFGREIYDVDLNRHNQTETSENERFSNEEQTSPLKLEHIIKKQNLLSKKLEDISPLEDTLANIKMTEQLKVNFADQKKELEKIEKHPHESSAITSETNKQMLYNQSVLKKKPEDVIKIPHRQDVMKFFDSKYNRTMESTLPTVKCESTNENSIGTAEMFFTEVTNAKKLPLVDEENDLKVVPKISEEKLKVEPLKKIASNHLQGQYKRQEQKVRTNEILRHFKAMMNPQKKTKATMKEIVGLQSENLGQMVVDCLNGNYSGKSTVKKLSLKQVQMLADEMNEIARQKRFEQRKFVPFKVIPHDLKVSRHKDFETKTLEIKAPEINASECNSNISINSSKIEKQFVVSQSINNDNMDTNKTWTKWFQKSKNTKKENENSENKIIGKMVSGFTFFTFLSLFYLSKYNVFDIKKRSNSKNFNEKLLTLIR